MFSHKQKAYFCQLAGQAYMLAAARARERGENPDMSRAAFAEFRQAQVKLAVGKAGLRCCSQSDFLPLKAHFQDLLGNVERAFQTHLRAQEEPRRQWETKLLQQLDSMGLTLDYAAGICRQMFHGLSLLEAEPSQLKKIFSALRYHQKRKNKAA